MQASLSLVLASTLLSCMLAISFDDYDHDTNGDTNVHATRRFKVTATAQGLDVGVTAAISLNGVSVGQVANGVPIVLPETVFDGSTYVVRVEATGHECDDAKGTISGADVSVTVQCGSIDTTLADLSVTSDAVAAKIVPKVTELTEAQPTCRALLPLFPLVGMASIVARAKSPRAKVTIAGTATTLGGEVAVPYEAAPTPVLVSVVAPRGKPATYTVVIDRGATYLKASNTRTEQGFGQSVVLSGDTLALGAMFESSGARGVNGNQNDISAPLAGAVYVFRRTAGKWAQEAYLKPSNTRAGFQFGSSLALFGDRLAVGAPLENSVARGVDTGIDTNDQKDTSAMWAGAVYLFTRTNGTWSQEAYVKATNNRVPESTEWMKFGTAVALTSDTLVVGAPGESSDATGGPTSPPSTDTSIPNAGAVYVFTRASGSWAPQAYVKPGKRQVDGRFGCAVALDGESLAVGSKGESTSLITGAAYVFTRTAGTWSQQASLEAQRPQTKASFGSSIAILGDTVAVGAATEGGGATGVNGNQDDLSAASSGAAYVFTRSGGTWTQQAYIKASNTRADAGFGRAVALSTDLLAVGAPNETSGGSGVGGPQDDSAARSSFGAAYVFARSGAVWKQRAYVKALNPQRGGMFGSSVALASDALVVGHLGDASRAVGIDGDLTDSSASNAGAVFVY